jgi:hypothetical protein
MATINLATGTADPPGWTSGALILAEMGTIQLEFKALSRHTGDPKWDQKAQATAALTTATRFSPCVTDSEVVAIILTLIR